MPKRDTGRWSTAAAGLAYAVLTVVLTHPVWLSARTAIPGIGQDGWQHYWNLWWLHRAVVERHASPFFTLELYRPYGAWLYFHSLEPAVGLMVVPIVGRLGVAA